MSWFKLTDEERSEIRKDPRVEALVATLRERIAMTSSECLSTMQDEADSAANHARKLAGRAEGLEMAIAIIGADQ
jgi:hypothetical protein